MSTNVPVSIWMPTTGNGEMSIGPISLFTTLSGLDIVTLSNNQLVTKDSQFTAIPVSIWSENDGV